MPILDNIKQDPFERLPDHESARRFSCLFERLLAREFWRFVYVQQKVGELAQTAIEFPPMQKGASFNLAGGEGADRSRDRQGTSRRLRREHERAPRRGARLFTGSWSHEGSTMFVGLVLSVVEAREVSMMNRLNRRTFLAALHRSRARKPCSTASARRRADPLPSWNDGPTKKSILDFVGGRDQGRRPGLCKARRAHRHLRQ